MPMPSLNAIPFHIVYVICKVYLLINVNAYTQGMETLVNYGMGETILYKTVKENESSNAFWCIAPHFHLASRFNKI